MLYFLLHLLFLQVQFLQLIRFIMIDLLGVFLFVELQVFPEVVIHFDLTFQLLNLLLLVLPVFLVLVFLVIQDLFQLLYLFVFDGDLLFELEIVGVFLVVFVDFYVVFR